MYYPFRQQMQHFIWYYRQMGWKLNPEDILEMCAEEIDDFDPQTWNFLMDARNYCRNLRRSDSN